MKLIVCLFPADADNEAVLKNAMLTKKTDNPSAPCDIFGFEDENLCCVKNFDVRSESKNFDRACSGAGGLLVTMPDRTFVCDELIVVVNGARLCGDPNACTENDTGVIPGHD